MTNHDIVDPSLVDVVQKFKALDNEVKLKIFGFLVEEGAKSITDISKGLRINFSTAHKYLEQLEQAGLVTSKSIAKDRLRRLFYVQDFSIDFSPRGVANLLSGRREKVKIKGGFKVITDKGEEEQFDEKKFSKEYLKEGIPTPIIESGLDYIRNQAYEGITLLELRTIFRDFIKSRINKLNESLENLRAYDVQERTYHKILEILYPECLAYHMDGTLFVANLRKARLLNFIHDLRGISIHGVNGKKARNLEDLFSQTFEAVNLVSGLMYPYQAFDSFNYFIAPLASKLSPTELLDQLRGFLVNLNNLNIRFYLNLDIGVPRFYTDITPTFFTEREKIPAYDKYKDVAAQITSQIIKILNEENLQNICPMFKVWEKGIDGLDLSKLNDFYIANLIPEWQTSNASYCGYEARFDCTWKGWMRTVRIGELQNIVINLPRIALKAKSESAFFEELERIIKFSLNSHSIMAELAMGGFLRKSETIFESVQKERWNYTEIDDSCYSISVAGLNEAVFFLSGKKMSKNVELAKKILKFCSDHIKNYSEMPIRITLKEEQNPIVSNRFYSLDSKKFKLDVNSYSPGALSDDYRVSGTLHKYLLGGHCIRIPKEKLDVKSLLKTDFGLAYIK